MQKLIRRVFTKSPLGANNDGPPDLDEMFKDLKNKVDNLFTTNPKNINGSGGNQKPTNINDGPGNIKILPIFIVVILIWMATGFYIVDQGSRGVVLRFGENTEVTQPGPRWHIPYPIETAEIVNQEQVRTIEVGYRSGGGGTSQELRESLMLTGDENIIDLQFAVQYNLKSVQDFIFNNRAADSSVRGASETAIREIVGKSKMDFVLYEGREEIAVKTKAVSYTHLTLPTIYSV